MSKRKEGVRRRRSLSRRDSFRLAAYLSMGLALAGCGLFGRRQSPTEGEIDPKGETRVTIDGVEVTVASICFQDRLVNSGDDPETSGSWSPDDPDQQFLLTLLMVDSKADLEKLKHWPRPGEANALAVDDKDGNRSEWSIGIPLEEEVSGSEEAARSGVFFVFLVNRTVSGLTLHFPDGTSLDLSTIPNDECWFEG